MYKKSIHWFRRDLRLVDNRALYEACRNSQQVISVFIFDTCILSKLKFKDDKRVNFIHETLLELSEELSRQGSQLIVLHGDPVIEIPKIAQQLGAECVFTNKDYEPYAKNRDHSVEEKLTNLNISFLKFKDQVIFEEKEILNGSGEPYKIFTSYKNNWNKKIRSEDFCNYIPNFKNLIKKEELNSIQKSWSLEDIGFKKSDIHIKTGRRGALERLKIFAPKINDYGENRNNFDLEGTSQVSIHLRFGTVSIRELFRYANTTQGPGNEIWKSELIWRDFYQMILSQFPHVVHSTFKKECNSLVWPGEEEHFIKWCEGNTGYPIIDAAMRYFNQTGWMHNRLRMIVASFLTKDLLISYKKGEEYFAQKLLDFELASNNGGWQWSASTGCDAQPYFRVFNPETQSKNFDPSGSFIRKHCPELKKFSDKYIHAPHTADILEQDKAQCKIGKDYPFPIVNHDKQRLKAIEMFKKL